MIAPYELSIKTPYLMIVFQLYPSAAKLLFDADTKKLNDDCVDLSTIKETVIENPLAALTTPSSIAQKTAVIAKFLSEHAREKGMEEYRKIQQAIQIIRSEEHTSALQSLIRITYADFFCKKKKEKKNK